MLEASGISKSEREGHVLQLVKILEFQENYIKGDLPEKPTLPTPCTSIRYYHPFKVIGHQDTLYHGLCRLERHFRFSHLYICTSRRSASLIKKLLEKEDRIHVNKRQNFIYCIL